MKFTNNEIKKMIKLYNTGESMNKIGTIFKCNPVTISNYLVKNNIKKRKYSPKNNRKRSVDLNFFKNINSNKKAYLLGLLISDGSIDNTGYGFQFTSKDLEQVELFKEILKSEHKICELNSYDKRTNKTYTRYNIHICSKEMVNDLRNIGIENNKSYNSPMPEIDDKYFWHFLRGLLDGDGSIMNYGDGRIRVQFIASEKITNHIKEIFENEGFAKIKSTILSEKDGDIIYTTKYSSYKDVLKIKENMYKNCGKYKLKRKYDIIKKLKKHTRGCYLAHKNKIWKEVEVYDINNIFIKKYSNINICQEDLCIKDKKYIYRVISGNRNHHKGYKFKYA